jgi:tRNA pseudouridine38-40 synthase
MLQRVVMGVEYNGALFRGWQKQKHDNKGPSIQEMLEIAISKVANHPVNIVCAGRTDAGVHASAQVIHFDSESERSLDGWRMGVNSNLPEGIAITFALFMGDDFHARFSATERRYRYFILNTPFKPGIMHNQVSWWRKPLDENLMHEAAQALIGEHDFSSFRAVGCQAHHPRRLMKSISVERKGQWLIVEICANAFLYHMVRNIMGVLLPIGEGKMPVSWCAEVLAVQDRKQAGVTAPGEGLYLVDVVYPHFPQVPVVRDGPYFWQLLGA